MLWQNSSNAVNNTGSPDSDNLNEKVFLAIFSIVTFIIITSNGVFSFVLWRKKSLHTPSNILLGALSLSDLLVGIVVQPLWIVEFSYRVRGRHFTSTDNILRIKHITTWFCILLSFLYIVCSSFDRYVAISSPFFYHAKATKKTHVWLTIICFVFSVCFYVFLAAIGKASKDVSMYIFLALMGSSLIITAFCNIKIFILLRKVKERTQPVITTRNEKQLAPRRANELKKTLTVGAITTLFIVCYLPFIIRQILQLTGTLGNIGKTTEYQSKLWTQFFVITNSLVNPVVYYARMATFRKAAIEVFCNRASTARVVPLNSSAVLPTTIVLDMKVSGENSEKKTCF